MANERSAQERLEVVNRALEKSQRVRNFEETPNLDRQLEGLSELPVGEHLNRLVLLGERREAIRILIDNEAIPKLEKQKLEVERQLVLDSQPESPKTSNTTESSVLPEPFDPENPRGLTLLEGAVLISLIYDRIAKGVINSKEDLKLFEDEGFRESWGKILEARRGAPPVSEEDLLVIREEVFMGLAKTVRNKKFDEVSEKTVDDNVRTVLLYVTVFQSNHPDDTLLENILEPNGLAYEVDRGGEPHNFRQLPTSDISAIRVQAPSAILPLVEDETLGNQDQTVEQNRDPDERVLPEDEVADALFRLIQGVLPREESSGDPTEMQGEVSHDFGVGVNQALGDDQSGEQIQDDGVNLADQEGEVDLDLDLADLSNKDETEGVTEGVDENMGLGTGPVNVSGETTQDATEIAGQQRSMTIERRDPEVRIRVEEITEQVFQSTLVRLSTQAQITREFNNLTRTFIEAQIERRYVHPIMHNGVNVFSRDDVVTLVYVKRHGNNISRREVRDLRNIITPEVEKHVNANQNLAKGK